MVSQWLPGESINQFRFFLGIVCLVFLRSIDGLYRIFCGSIGISTGPGTPGTPGAF